MSVRLYQGIAPRIHPSCFVEESAQIVGDVELGEDASVWFNTVVRGDVNPIRIGRRTNLQDLCVVHVTKDKFSTRIGDEVTVGHHAVLHGCEVGNRVLIGIGAILMDGVVVEDECLVAAGTLLTPGTHIPPGSVVMGSPGRVRRSVTSEERRLLTESAANYVRYSAQYRGLSPRNP